MSWLQQEEILFEGQGLYSKVKVTKKGSRVNLYTGNNYLQSSYDPDHKPTGTVFDWYLAGPWFSGCFDGRLESILILGLGAGSQVKLFNQAYNVKKIIGVEIDPLIIELGKKYFDLNDCNLEIVQSDVTTYHHLGHFDLIILDAYKENRFDEVSGTSVFIQNVRSNLSDGGVLIINRVLGDVANRDLEKDLTNIFKTVYALKVINNVFYLCTNSEKSPKTAEKVEHTLKSAVQTAGNLGFFKSFKISKLRLLSSA